MSFSRWCSALSKMFTRQSVASIPFWNVLWTICKPQLPKLISEKPRSFQRLVSNFDQFTFGPSVDVICNNWAFGSSYALFSKPSFRFTAVACLKPGSRNILKLLNLLPTDEHKSHAALFEFWHLNYCQKEKIIICDSSCSNNVARPTCWYKHALFYHICSSQRYCYSETPLQIVVFKISFSRHAPSVVSFMTPLPSVSIPNEMEWAMKQWRCIVQ